MVEVRSFEATLNISTDRFTAPHFAALAVIPQLWYHKTISGYIAIQYIVSELSKAVGFDRF